MDFISSSKNAIFPSSTSKGDLSSFERNRSMLLDLMSVKSFVFSVKSSCDEILASLE
jgi:hypothetical protein